MKNMNIKNNISVVSAVLLSLFVFAGVFAMNINTVSAADCGTSGVRSEVYVEGTTAFVSVSNDNSNCSVPVNLKSYKMYDTVLSNQTLYDNANVTVGPNSTETVRVNIPQCVTQIDAYLGQGPTIPAPGYTILSWAFASNGVDVGHGFPTSNYCTNPTPPPPVIPAVNGSCSATPASIQTGNSIAWLATASGGTGAYTYSWAGTDGLTGSGVSASQAYSIAGNKTASVTITSGTQSVVKTCSAVVTAPVVNQTLSGSCLATPASVNIGSSINWVATASGGTGAYTYSWTGTDGLTGGASTASQTYSTAGTKTGTVTITSGSQSVTQTCSAVVSQNIINNNLAVSCNASPSSVPTGSSVSWSASATGGTGSYFYSWTGTDGLYGNSAYISNYYNYAGTKYGYVTVTSNGQTATQTCTANVYDNNNYNYNTYNNMSVTCYASPSNTQVGSQMNWYAVVSGGSGSYYNYNNNYNGGYYNNNYNNGGYNYSWTGSDGLYSSSQSPYMSYTTPGSKFATVSVMNNNGQRVSATCYANVTQNSVLAFTSSYQAPLAAAVYLSEIPSTGTYDNFKLIFFVGFLALMSAWIAYIIIERKKETGEIN